MPRWHPPRPPGGSATSACWGRPPDTAPARLRPAPALPGTVSDPVRDRARHALAAAAREWLGGAPAGVGGARARRGAVRVRARGRGSHALVAAARDWLGGARPRTLPAAV